MGVDDVCLQWSNDDDDDDDDDFPDSRSSRSQKEPLNQNFVTQQVEQDFSSQNSN